MATVLLAACANVRPNDHPTSDTNFPNLLPSTVVTEQGRMASQLYLVPFVIAVIIFLLVEGLLIFISFRFRRRRHDSELPTQTHGNNMLEILWTAVPAVIVLGLFILSTSVLFNETTEAKQPDVTVDVTGFQWQWTFAYPDYGLSYTGAGKNGPEMVVPVDKTVHIRLHAQDVIHSFYVPEFFYKKDAVPGRTNEFDVKVDQAGTYGGQCAEFCGLAHADMYFTVRAVTPDEFTSWVASEQAKANATPAPAPSGGVQAATISVKAISITAGFDPKDLTAPADTPLTIEFQNTDQTAPHNFSISGANADGSDFIGMPIAQAGQKATYQAPALQAGQYKFYCSVHPNMVGTLTVQ